jgi:uncharacterized protein (DUF302 family)
VVADGLITLASNFPVPQTIDRLADAATAAGLRIFARLDHAAGASEVGLQLRPTQLLLFGHPRGGTPLMQDQQTAGIDLPFKALAWTDETGQTWLSYNDPDWIAERHGLGEASASAVRAMSEGMGQLARTAASADPAPWGPAHP